MIKLTDKAKLALLTQARWDVVDNPETYHYKIRGLHDDLLLFSNVVQCHYADLIIDAIQGQPEAPDDDDIGEVTANNANAGMIGAL